MWAYDECWANFLRNLPYPNLPFTERGSKRQQTCKRKMEQSTTTTGMLAQQDEQHKQVPREINISVA